MQPGLIHRFTLARSRSVNAVMPAHTDLAVIFDALGHCERAYDWVLIDPVAEVIAACPAIRRYPQSSGATAGSAETASPRSSLGRRCN
jgi:hypothetical protein